MGFHINVYTELRPKQLRDTLTSELAPLRTTFKDFLFSTSLISKGFGRGELYYATDVNRISYMITPFVQAYVDAYLLREHTPQFTTSLKSILYSERHMPVDLYESDDHGLHHVSLDEYVASYKAIRKILDEQDVNYAISIMNMGSPTDFFIKQRGQEPTLFPGNNPIDITDLFFG